MPFMQSIKCLGVVTVVMTMTGCGGSDPAPGKTGVSPSRSQGDQMIRHGAIAAKIRGLDPMDIGDTTSSSIASNFYECLYQYHYLKRPYEVVPCLASRTPTFSSDGLTLTIPIRQDVYFHDDECFPDGKGRQLVAEDFVYSWKRIAYLKNVSKNWWILDDRITGLDEFREATKGIEKSQMDYRQEVEGLKAIDKFTLRIKLVKPWPAVLFGLSHLPLAAVAREAVEHYGDNLINHPVGTGPFRLTQWIRGSTITMGRNENFREELYPAEGQQGDQEAGLLEDAGKRLPLIDGAKFKIILEDSAYWLTFMNRDIDSAGIPKDNFNSAINENRDLSSDMAARGVVLHKFAEPTTFWIGFNMEDPVLAENLPLRQAMNLAFNRQAFIKRFSNGRGIISRGPLPPGTPEYNPDLDSPYTVYNLDKAKQKVAEAKALHLKRTGQALPTLKMLVPGTDTTAMQVSQSYRREFKKAGIDVDVDNLDWPAMQDKVKTKSAQIYTMGWIMDWPDAENMLLLWHGPNKSPGPNNMNYDNPEFNELYEKITVMPPSPERIEILQQLEQIVVNDLPCVFNSHRVSFLLRYKWLKNYKPHVYGYGLMKYQNIDLDLRRKLKAK